MFKYALSHPDIEECMEVVSWRNEVRETLRSPGFSNYMNQEKFYNEICDPRASKRFFSFKQVEESGKESSDLLGFGGFTDISRENRSAEVSIIINPALVKNGFGSLFLEALLFEGFNNMNLNSIVAECYECNPSIEFWVKSAAKYGAPKAYLPDRKFWNGKYWKSMVVTFLKENY